MIGFLIDVLLRAGDIALLSVALSAGYSLVKFPNVALFQYATVAPFLTYLLARLGLPFVAAAAAACILVGALAVALNIFVFERLLRSGSAIAMIGSLALGMVFTAGLLVTAGPSPMRFDFPIAPPWNLWGSPITSGQVAAIAADTVALAGLAALLFVTDLGRCMRATAANADLARATGIDAQFVLRAVIFMSGGLAALGGICTGLKGELTIQLGADMLLPVFAAAILGGLGNPMGAVLGALVIAVTETLATTLDFGPLIGRAFAFLPINYVPVASFAILVATLLFRPYGLFVNEVKRV